MENINRQGERLMANIYLVGVRGELSQNDDGTSRQNIIKELKVGQQVSLVADGMNKYNGNTIAVFAEDKKQIGFLPPDARDSISILRGEPIVAHIHKLTGGTNWFARTILGKKYIGVVLKLTKSEIDWSRFNRLREVSQKFDDKIVSAHQTEKNGEIDQAVSEYKAIVEEIYKLTTEDRYASAHRYKPSPINHLSMCLEKQKKYLEALEIIERYENTFDPVFPTNTEAEVIKKRKMRLIERLKGIND